jgi:opacity protein-like surface antigen
MYPRRVLALTLALLGAASTTARADGFISPFLGFTLGGDSGCPGIGIPTTDVIGLFSCEDKRRMFGASLGTTRGIVGFEQDIAYAPDFFGRNAGGDSAMLTLMSNLTLGVPAGPIRPYVLVGVGLMRPHVKFDALSLALDKNALGYDIGGGINLFVTRGVGVRGDVRRLRTLKEVTLGVFSADQIDFWRASAGLTFRF